MLPGLMLSSSHGATCKKCSPLCSEKSGERFPILMQIALGVRCTNQVGGRDHARGWVGFGITNERMGNAEWCLCFRVVSEK
jgi:hypothetical protein